MGVDASPRPGSDLPQRFTVSIKGIHNSVFSSGVKLCVRWSWGEIYRESHLILQLRAEGCDPALAPLLLRKPGSHQVGKLPRRRTTAPASGHEREPPPGPSAGR